MDNCKQDIVLSTCSIYDGKETKTYQVMLDGKMILINSKDDTNIKVDIQLDKANNIFIGKSVALCPFCKHWMISQQKVNSICCPSCECRSDAESV